MNFFKDNRLSGNFTQTLKYGRYLYITFRFDNQPQTFKENKGFSWDN